MVAFGWADERIAGVLEITLPTLKKHYPAELKLRGTARDRLIVEAAATFWQQFQDGNTNAGKAFMALAERNDLAIHGQTIPAARPLGKKEQALRDARQARSQFTDGTTADGARRAPEAEAEAAPH